MSDTPRNWYGPTVPHERPPRDPDDRRPHFKQQQDTIPPQLHAKWAGEAQRHPQLGQAAERQGQGAQSPRAERAQSPSPERAQSLSPERADEASPAIEINHSPQGEPPSKRVPIRDPEPGALEDESSDATPAAPERQGRRRKVALGLGGVGLILVLVGLGLYTAAPRDGALTAPSEPLPVTGGSRKTLAESVSNAPAERKGGTGESDANARAELWQPAGAVAPSLEGRSTSEPAPLTRSVTNAPAARPVSVLREPSARAQPGAPAPSIPSPQAPAPTHALGEAPPSHRPAASGAPNTKSALPPSAPSSTTPLPSIPPAAVRRPSSAPSPASLDLREKILRRR